MLLSWLRNGITITNLIEIQKFYLIRPFFYLLESFPHGKLKTSHYCIEKGAIQLE